MFIVSFPFLNIVYWQTNKQSNAYITIIRLICLPMCIFQSKHFIVSRCFRYKHSKLMLMLKKRFDSWLQFRWLLLCLFPLKLKKKQQSTISSFVIRIRQSKEIYNAVKNKIYSENHFWKQKFIQHQRWMEFHLGIKENLSKIKRITLMIEVAVISPLVNEPAINWRSHMCWIEHIWKF